jgi:hypothetical protein
MDRMEVAVYSGTAMLHDKEFFRRRQAERARRHAPARKFKSAADAFAQIARDFPNNVKTH